MLNGKPLVTPEEVQARIKAALGWFEKYKHMVISSGSFYLARFDPEAQFAELRAFRHPTYPFKPGNTTSICKQLSSRASRPPICASASRIALE
ncbi:MAG: hypothetical protein RMJ90_03355 [Candidatus Bipolaricaulota bacterium]|nr:hypothetical protein [Candidatus Bipolaricaulota bacterium]